MTIYVLVGMSLLAAVAALGVVLYFRDKQLARTHESKITLDVLARSSETAAAVSELDTHVRKSLENYKTTLVAVLEQMRDLVKNTESERQRVAGNAAATLLRPGRGRMPQP